MTAGWVLDHPDLAPELLALAAVRTLGPRAADWAAWHRAAYPGATPDGLARLAARRFVRLAGAGGAVAALAGLFAPVVELTAVLWAQANLVLHLAAAHGRDPADPERAVELLVLTRVHPDARSARTAVEAAERTTRERTTAVRPTTEDRPSAGQVTAGQVTAGAPQAARAVWRLAGPLTGRAGGWLGLRVASRLLPGAAVLTAAVGDSAAAERLAARAVAAYRSAPAPAPVPPGPPAGPVRAS
ncbi:hypothetical protein [Micromonospora sp. WMMD712]|uniref:hypothetical protein n=1 Tax=Micromonospora sp. WMMD712 TaxID=3016096 RepID=UPI00249BE45E|nr:hypothetical protein [Micromonospora sp. WMMD712]WFE58621.1 hypothetical protein O7633_17995 [Micromonospora sp. WMMD712]